MIYIYVCTSCKLDKAKGNNSLPKFSHEKFFIVLQYYSNGNVINMIIDII